jgi:uncharacterized protein
MLEFFSDIAFTPAVKAIQSEKGSRSSYARMESGGSWETTVTPQLEAFLSDLDMFYLGTANAEGQPYIQYRGGSPGFLKVVNETTLGFADFGGNRQYISLGNISENPRAFIFLMDYGRSRRIKLWGTLRVVEGDLVLLDQLRDPSYPGKAERAMLFEIEAWDLNCSQHILKRFSQSQVAPVIEKLQARITALESELRQATGEQSTCRHEVESVSIDLPRSRLPLLQGQLGPVSHADFRRERSTEWAVLVLRQNDASSQPDRRTNLIFRCMKSAARVKGGICVSMLASSKRPTL